jgi:hypothetical protein
MKLSHYRMIDAFKAKDVAVICSILEDHFGISLSGVSAEIIERDHYAGNKVVLFNGRHHYYWSEYEGFYDCDFGDLFPMLLRIHLMVTL